MKDRYKEVVKKDLLEYLIPVYKLNNVNSENRKVVLAHYLIEKLKREFKGTIIESSEYKIATVDNLTPNCHYIVFENEFITGKIEIANSSHHWKHPKLGLTLSLFKNTTKRNLMSVERYDELYKKVFDRLQEHVSEELVEFVITNESKSSYKTWVSSGKRCNYGEDSVKRIINKDCQINIESFFKTKMEVVSDVLVEELRNFSYTQKNYLKKLSLKTSLMNYNSSKLQLVEDEIEKLDTSIFTINFMIHKNHKNENSIFKTWTIRYTKEFLTSSGNSINYVYLFPFRLNIKVKGDVYFIQKGRQIVLKSEESLKKLFDLIKNPNNKIFFVYDFEEFCNNEYNKYKRK